MGDHHSILQRRLGYISGDPHTIQCDSLQNIYIHNVESLRGPTTYRYGKRANSDTAGGTCEITHNYHKFAIQHWNKR